MDQVGETTRLLNAVGAGDAGAIEQLFGVVHERLRAIAGDCFRAQRADHTLQPTALVNEAFLKMLGSDNTQWQNRAHFLAVAAAAMRQILIDHARRRARVKRGGGLCRVTLDGDATPVTDSDPEMLDLDDALHRLAALDERQSKVVELRFFGGMTVEEVAHVLDVSRSTIEADWRMARAWLRRELMEGERDAGTVPAG